MIDLLVADLDKEITEAKVEEKNAQADYEKLIAEAGEKRAKDAKSIDTKNADKASSEEALEKETDNLASATKDLGAINTLLHNLHGECDWLLKYYEVRRDARTGELEALDKAKAVLNG